MFSLLSKLFYNKAKNDTKSAIIKTLSKSTVTGDAPFFLIDYSTVSIQYKNTVLKYNDFKKAFFKLYPSYIKTSIENKTFFDNIETIKQIIGILPFENRNRVVDYDFIIDGLQKYNLKVFFKDWVKQTEHPDISSFAWYLYEIGVLDKKKEKNRVFYKICDEVDYLKIFREAIIAEEKMIDYSLGRNLDILSNEEVTRIKIPRFKNSYYEIITNKKCIFLDKIFNKFEAPLIPEVYHPIFTDTKNIQKSDFEPSIITLLEITKKMSNN